MINELIFRYPELTDIKNEIMRTVDMMESTYKNGGKILVCGNGGSCADCEHIVGELMKGFMSKRPLSKNDVMLFDGISDNPINFAENLQLAIPAISLPSQSAVLSAFSNDVNPAMAYAQLTFGYGRENDLIICISTSGNSANVINAAIAAKARKMKSVALTGADGGMLASICDAAIKVPETETYKVQEYHLPIYHFLCAELEKRLFS